MGPQAGSNKEKKGWLLVWVPQAGPDAPQSGIRTLQLLLVSPGMMALRSQGRSSQQVDGSIGDNFIVVICQLPLAPPESGTLLLTE